MAETDIPEIDTWMANGVFCGKLDCGMGTIDVGDWPSAAAAARAAAASDEWCSLGLRSA
jgi:hypothetical protein